MEDLKLLEELEQLGGLPLEKDGLKIKKSLLNTDKALLKKADGISGPYILIEGDRENAKKLAAYIYLVKSTVYSKVYLRGNGMGIRATAPLRKAKNPEPQLPLPWNPGEMPKKASRVYIELGHHKSTLQPWQSYGLAPKSQRQKLSVKRRFAMYRYLNRNGFVEGESSRLGDIRYGQHLKFVDYYKDAKEGRVTRCKYNFTAMIDEFQAEHKCSKIDAMMAIVMQYPEVQAKSIALYERNVNLKFIKNVIYSNNFRYVEWENSTPKKLLELKLMDRRGTTGMVMFDMLKYKSTVFLLDFMKGMEGEERKELLEFSKKLNELKRDDTPGFLIIHMDKIKGLKKEKDFLDLFEVIIKIKKGSGNIGGQLKASDRKSYEDNEEYMKLLKDTLQKILDSLLKENRKTYKKDHYITTACISSVQEAMEKDKGKRFTRDKYNKNTRREDLIYGRDNIKKSIHGHDIWNEMKLEKNKLDKK